MPTNGTETSRLFFVRRRAARFIPQKKICIRTLCKFQQQVLGQVGRIRFSILLSLKVCDYFYVGGKHARLMSTPNSKTRGWSSLAGLGQPRRFFFFLLSLCSPSRGSWMCFMSSYSSAKSHISRSVSVTAFSPRIFFMIWRHLRNGGVAKSIAPKITWWLGGWSRDAGSEV